MPRSLQQYGLLSALVTIGTGVLMTIAGIGISQGYLDTFIQNTGLLELSGHPRTGLTVLACLFVLLPGLICLHRLNQQYRQAINRDLQLASYLFKNPKIEISNNQPRRPLMQEFEPFFIQLSQSHGQIAAERRRLIDFGLTDHLSRLPNRRALDIKLEECHTQTRQFGVKNSLLLIDLDKFKSVNDNYGHGIGDLLIQRFATYICANVRESDFVARLGGDEFCIIFINSSLATADKLSRRLRQQLPLTIELTPDISHPLLWTAGLAGFETQDNKCTVALQRADQALLQAKRSGRNRTLSISNYSDKYPSHQLHQPEILIDTARTGS